MDLIQVISKDGLKQQASDEIKTSFILFFNQAQEWKKKAEKLVVTNESQVQEMKDAREARLALRRIRVDADKKRKELKADSLKYGNAVQKVYNVIEGLIKPIEEHLQEQEDYIKLKEAARKEKLNDERIKLIEPYSEFIPLMDFREMSDEDFNKLLNGAKLQKQEKERREAEEVKRLKEEEEARIKAEEERIRQQAIEEERKKQEIAQQKAIEEERKNQQKILEEERKKQQEAIEKERKKLEAEREKIRQEAIEEERKRTSAINAQVEKDPHNSLIPSARILAETERKEKEFSDKEVLLDLALKLERYPLPMVEDKELIKNVETLLKKIATYIREKV